MSAAVTVAAFLLCDFGAVLVCATSAVASIATAHNVQADFILLLLFFVTDGMGLFRCLNSLLHLFDGLFHLGRYVLRKRRIGQRTRHRLPIADHPIQETS